MSHWSLEPVFGWLVLLPLTLLLLTSLWFTLTASGIGWLGRACLVLIRFLAIALLLLGWLRPGLVTSVQRDSQAAVAVLIDASQSMTLPSGYAQQSRWDIARQIWQDIERESQNGFGQTRFVPYTFDFNLHPVALQEPAQAAKAMESLWKTAPAGTATDLGAALAELQRTQVDPPLRGALLLSDGNQTVVPAQADPTMVARQLAQMDQPLIVLGIGPKSENSNRRDLALDNVPEHITAFEKNRVAIPAVLHATGMQNSPIKILMTLKSSGQADIVLPPIEVLASQASQTMPLSLDVEAPKSGEYLLEVKATSDVPEEVTGNNASFAFLTVRTGGARILYIEGQPRHEQTFLKRALNASLDFQVEYVWLQQVARNRWPVDLTKDQNFQNYDAFILGDIDAKALGPVSLNALRKRVELGAGLLTLGGYHSYEAGGYASSPLADLLPVVLAPGRSQDFDGPINESFHLPGPIAMVPSMPHPITHLAMEPENSQLWKDLPPLLGANRFGKLKNVPGVQAIVTSSNDAPLLVTGEYGRGRVLAFAGDSTYQWWLEGKQLRHKQFWRQALLWLLGRDSLQEGFRLTLDRRRLLRGDEETVGIEWVGGNTNKPMPKSITLELIRDGKWLRNLDSQESGENRRQVRLKDLTQPGLYRLLLKATSEEGTAYSSDVAFVVRDESRELNAPLADWQMLESIAVAGEMAGSRLISRDDLPATLDWLRKRQAETRVTTLEKRRLGDGVWDSWLYFILFCGSLTLEWALRKRWNLP